MHLNLSIIASDVGRIAPKLNTNSAPNTNSAGGNGGAVPKPTVKASATTLMPPKSVKRAKSSRSGTRAEERTRGEERGDGGAVEVASNDRNFSRSFGSNADPSNARAMARIHSSESNARTATAGESSAANATDGNARNTDAEGRVITRPSASVFLAFPSVAFAADDSPAVAVRALLSLL